MASTCDCDTGHHWGMWRLRKSPVFGTREVGWRRRISSPTSCDFPCKHFSQPSYFVSCMIASTAKSFTIQRKAGYSRSRHWRNTHWKWTEGGKKARAERSYWGHHLFPCHRGYPHCFPNPSDQTIWYASKLYTRRERWHTPGTSALGMQRNWKLEASLSYTARPQFSFKTFKKKWYGMPIMNIPK